MTTLYGKILRFGCFGIFIPLLIVSGSVITGCYSTSQVETKQELLFLSVDDNPIRLLTTDSKIYSFKQFTYTDSTISGEGIRIEGRTEEVFEGSLRFDEIVFIERLEQNNWQAFWIVPMAVGIAYGLPMLLESSFLDVRILLPSQTNGSCPYIYSFDGSDFVLEGEAFSTSISRSLESETFHMLHSLQITDDELLVRVSNERPETHLVNKVQLFAVDTHDASSAILDTENTAWPVYEPASPVFAQDHSGNDILGLVQQQDGNYWISDMKNSRAFSGFRDQLDVTFTLPGDRSEAIFIVHAMNTDMVTQAYQMVGTILGDETLHFYQALETDPEMKELVTDWIEKTSLVVEVEQDDGWIEVDRILPEANVASFSRAVRLENLDQFDDSLNVRVSSLTDVWRIDALMLDTSEVTPLQKQPLEMVSVRSSIGKEWEETISRSDSSYALLMPPEYMDIRFDPAPARQMDDPRFIFAAQGFLYEWFPDLGDLALFGLTLDLDDIDRVELLKLLIQQEDLFLPPIYAKWSEDGR